MDKFEKLNIGKNLMVAIKRLGFTEPTQIQEESIPAIMEGKDVIGESATGSGKTLAFGAGIIDKVQPGQGVQALVLTPTRELAEQVTKELIKFKGDKRLRIISVYGGVSYNPQMEGLERAEVVVATPGRMLDHIGRGTVNLSKVQVFVLDEADRMFEMGFIEDVEQIMDACPKKRQNLLFSATISPRVKDLGKRFLYKPVEVYAKKHVDPSKLKQVYYDLNSGMKFSLLVHLLKKDTAGLVMIFCNTRRNVDFVVKNLKENGIKAIAIHGGFTQNKRNKTMELFNDAKVKVLVATDVAARGLHIDNVSHVYNYDIPKDANEYVHRIGRTARAGENGMVVNLLTNHDYDNFRKVQWECRSFAIKKLEKPFIERANIMKVEVRRGFGSRGHGSRDRFADRSGRDSRGGFSNRDSGSRARSVGRGSNQRGQIYKLTKGRGTPRRAFAGRR